MLGRKKPALPARDALGEFEHHVMLALLRLGGRGYSAPIVDELEAATGRPIAPAAVFIALRRLEQRGYLRSSKKEAKPGEGGRGRRDFALTAQGLERLDEARRTLERLWHAGDPLITDRA
jgi:PadR family transcriptional regulator PadR